MSEQTGEKTEQPTPRKLEEALKKGQIAHSPELQTALVLLAGVTALAFTGRESWANLVGALVASLSHLHDLPLGAGNLQAYALKGALLALQCTGPVMLATALGGLLAGAIQTRFNTAPEALTPDWGRLNPVAGFQRLFSFKQAAPTALSAGKLAVILLLSYAEIRSILDDPVFTTSVSVARLAGFLAESSLRIFLRISLALLAVAAADYGYQWWRNHQDMMMTKDEVKEELKSSEGNPLIKSARRRRLRLVSKRKMLAAVPTADVVVTNPTHIAIALRYDRKTMKAPKIVAKGIRLNAQRIREIAELHHVPVVENQPLARLMFKYGRVDGEIPAQLYAAVAEILAWVYRVNRYRYYAEANQT